MKKTTLKIFAYFILFVPALLSAAPISGTNLSAPITPGDTADTFPTHYANYGAGGYMQVANEAAMIAIPAGRRIEGMECYIAEDQTVYRLDAGLTSWTEVVVGDSAQVETNKADIAAIMTNVINPAMLLDMIYTNAASIDESVSQSDLLNSDDVVVCIGDSISSDAIEWFGILQSWYPEANMYRHAYGGWQTGHHMTNLVVELDSHWDETKRNRVMMLIGINDMALGGETVSGTWDDWLELALEIMNRAGTDANPWKLTALCYYSWPSEMSVNLKELNSLIKDNAMEYGYDVVDMWLPTMDFDTGYLKEEWDWPEGNINKGHMLGQGQVVAAELVRSHMEQGFRSNILPSGVYEQEDAVYAYRPINLMGTVISTDTNGLVIDGAPMVIPVSQTPEQICYDYEHDYVNRLPNGKPISFPEEWAINGIDFWVSQQRNSEDKGYSFVSTNSFAPYDWGQGTEGDSIVLTEVPLWQTFTNGADVYSGLTSEDDTTEVRFQNNDCSNINSNGAVSFVLITNINPTSNPNNSQLLSNFGLDNTGIKIYCTGEGRYRFGYWDSGTLACDYFTGHNAEGNSDGISFIGISFDPSDSTKTFMMVDDETDTSSTDPYSLPDLELSEWELFQNRWEAGNAGVGTIFEVIAWPGTTTQDGMTAIKNFMLDKYGL